MVKPDVFVLGKSPEFSNLGYNYTYRIPQHRVTLHTFNIIKRMSKSKYFYLVKESALTNIDFEQEVYEYENVFVKWNGDDSVRLFNLDLLMENPKNFTDEVWESGTLENVNVYNIVDDAIHVTDTRLEAGYDKSLCQTVILTKGWPEWADDISSRYYPIIHIDSDDLDENAIEQIIAQTSKPILYIVRNELECNGQFQLDWIPPLYDRKYAHCWNDSYGLIMVARSELESTPSRFTDEAFELTVAPLKWLTDGNVTINERINVIPEPTDEINPDLCQTVILTKGWPEWADEVCSKYWPVVHIDSNTLSENEITQILKETDRPILYIVRNKVTCTGEFQLNWVPVVYDRQYAHIWNREHNLMLVSRLALDQTPEKFTDESFVLGCTPVKWIDDDTVDVESTLDDIDISKGFYDRDQCQTVILTRGWPEWADRASTQFWPFVHIDVDYLTTDTISQILDNTDRPILYIVRNEVKCSGEFQLNWVPPIYDHQYAHIWNQSRNLMMVSRSALEQTPENFTDEAYDLAAMSIKWVQDDAVYVPLVDKELARIYDKSLCQVVVLTKGWPEWANDISSRYYPIMHIDSNELSDAEIEQILKETDRPILYIIRDEVACAGEFQLNWVPPMYDHQYAHIWNQSRNLMMVARSELESNPSGHTDLAFVLSESPVKWIEDQTVTVSEWVPCLKSFEPEKTEAFILTKDWPEWANRMASKIWPLTHIDSFCLGFDEIDFILEKVKPSTKHVYIIRNDIDFGKFDLSKTPEGWNPLADKNYIHVWNDSFDLQLISLDILTNQPELCTDHAIRNGFAELKESNSSELKFRGRYDVVMLSCGEAHADTNFEKLKARSPNAIHIAGVQGIFEAHKTAANLVKTEMFYVVDADAEVKEDFSFNWRPSFYDTDCVHVWRSENPCNGLKYGYGGIKLFPTEKLRNTHTQSADFTTSVSAKFKAMEQVSNVTRFNTDEFSAWRSGFREAAKLAARVIDRQIDAETARRLDIWCSVANDEPYAEACRNGALCGKEYGLQCRSTPTALNKINDYTWLRKQYEIQYLLSVA